MKSNTLDSIFARRFWRYNYCEKSFWFFSSPLHYKKWASSHCKIFPIYILSSRKSCLFSQKEHMIWPKMWQNQVLFYTYVEDLDKIYQIFIKVSSSCNRNRWVSEYKRKIFWICFDQSKLYLIQKNIMYKISALLPLLFLGALAFPNNRYNEDGNKINLLGTLKLTITILLLK